MDPLFDNSLFNIIEMSDKVYDEINDLVVKTYAKSCILYIYEIFFYYNNRRLRFLNPEYQSQDLVIGTLIYAYFSSISFTSFYKILTTIFL